MALSLPPFTVRNYPQMLYKVSFFSSFLFWIFTFFLRKSPIIDAPFTFIETLLPLDKLLNAAGLSVNLTISDINIGGAILAFVYALFSYSVPVHDKLSDLFKIRQHFDTTRILIPLALLSG
jgi:hypothetical protein